MIVLNQVSMTFGQKLLFFDVSLNLQDNKCYALLGANGSGKSTFFKLITQEEETSSGELILPKDASVGWLKQDHFRYEDTPIRDIVLQGRPQLWHAWQEREELLTQSNWTDIQGYRYAELEDLIVHANGYQAVSEVEIILTGLGLAAHYFDQPLKVLSGGYKLRVLLAQSLFQQPSILLLDEPTNHLDIISIQWLESFLKYTYKGLVILISHDVDFTDHLADIILDIDYGEIREYSGRYDRFLNEKAMLEEQKLIEKQTAESKISAMQQFIDRFGAKASKAVQARSRLKMIEKIEIPDVKQSSRQAPKFKFTLIAPLSKQILEVKGLSHAFGDNVLFKSIHCRVGRGEKIAIMGANGIGKSTLLKLLLGQMPPLQGDHHDLLNQSMTVLDWLQLEVAEVTEQSARSVLSQVLFNQEDVRKNILKISGGEAARLLLAKVMLEKPGIIILDEPTNHMDIESIDALAAALQAFQGTVLCVSHNRHFINQFATRILYFESSSCMRDFHGNYADFQKQGT